MQLLNLPAKATHQVCCLRRILSQIIGDNEIRAVGRHLDPETLHFMVFRKAFDLEALALRLFERTSSQRINSAIRLLKSKQKNLRAHSSQLSSLAQKLDNSLLFKVLLGLIS